MADMKRSDFDHASRRSPLNTQQHEQVNKLKKPSQTAIPPKTSIASPEPLNQQKIQDNSNKIPQQHKRNNNELNIQGEGPDGNNHLPALALPEVVQRGNSVKSGKNLLPGAMETTFQSVRHEKQPIFPPTMVASPRDRTSLKMNMMVNSHTSTALISPKTLGQGGQQTSSQVQASNPNMLKQPVITIGASQQTLKQKSQRATQAKMRNLASSSQKNPSDRNHHSPPMTLQGPQHMVKKMQQQHAKAKLNNDIPAESHRRNLQQSPMMMHTSVPDARVLNNGSASGQASFEASTAGVGKTQKTRNNLQSHVVSSNVHSKRQAVVGQPYINFKNQHQSSQYIPKGLPNKNLDSVERANQVYVKHAMVVKNRYQQQDRIQQNKINRLTQGSISSVAENQNTDIVSSQGGLKSALQTRVGKNVSKSSFSQGSNSGDTPQEVNNGLKYPQLVSQSGKKIGHKNSAARAQEWDSSSVVPSHTSNYVINVLGASSGQNSNRNVNMRHRKHQKSQWNLGLGGCSLINPSSHGGTTGKPGKASPYMQRVKRNNNRSQDSVDQYQGDLPIAISDQEQREHCPNIQQHTPSETSVGVYLNQQVQNDSLHRRTLPSSNADESRQPMMNQEANQSVKSSSLIDLPKASILASKKRSHRQDQGPNIVTIDSNFVDATEDRNKSPGKESTEPSIQMINVGTVSNQTRDEASVMALTENQENRKELLHMMESNQNGNDGLVEISLRQSPANIGDTDQTIKEEQSMSQKPVELSNLSAYQSHAIVSRQKAAASSKGLNNSSIRNGYGVGGKATSTAIYNDKTSLSQISSGHDGIDHFNAERQHQYGVGGGSSSIVNGPYSRTSKQIGAPYATGKSSLSFRGGYPSNTSRQFIKESIAQKKEASQNKAKERNNYVLTKQFVQNNHVNFQSQQLKKFAIKESVKLEPILNNRYSEKNDSNSALQKVTNDRDASENDKDLPANSNSTSARRKINHLSSTNNSKSNRSRRERPSAAAGNFATSGMHRNEVMNNSLRSIRNVVQGQHGSSLAHQPNDQNAGSTETITSMGFQHQRSNELSTSGLNEGLMLIQQDHNPTISSTTGILSQPYTEKVAKNHPDDTSSLDRGGVEVDVAGMTGFDDANSTFNNSVVTTTHVTATKRDGDGSLFTPGRQRQEDQRHNALNNLANVSQSRKVKPRRTMQGYEKMPYLKQNKVLKNNIGSLDRKRLLLKNNGVNVASTLSPSPSQMAATQQSSKPTVGSLTLRVKDKEARELLTQQTNQEDEAQDKNEESQIQKSRHAQKKEQVTGRGHNKRKSINSTKEQTRLEQSQLKDNNKSFSPRLRATYERSSKRKRENAAHLQKFATNDHRMDTSVGLSSSVTSLPKIIAEEKGSVYNMTQQSNLPQQPITRRLGSHRPSHKVVPSKQSFQSHNSPRGVVAPSSQRPTISKKQQSQQPILTPKTTGKQGLSQAQQASRSLKKSTQSFSVLKQKNSAQNQAESQSRTGDNRIQLPKLKKQVSIKEQDFGLRTSTNVDQNDYDEENGGRVVKVSSVERRSSKQRPKGTPMTIRESAEVPADDVQKSKPSRRARHVKSNSLVDTIQSAEQRREEAGGRSMSISIRQSNQSLRNSGSSPLAEVEGNGEHQIRIEISKTEVIDSMKKEHVGEMSLLYYDFNNSKARLMSKMKKMSDYVIQEEENDGDGNPVQLSREQSYNQRGHSNSPIKVNTTRLTHQHSFSKNANSSIASNSPTKARLLDDSPAAFSNKSRLTHKNQNSQMMEASSAIKQLDLPVQVAKQGLLSSQDLAHSQKSAAAIQTDMDFVNKKIDKAKLSISQLQTEGGLHSIGLQSPARLANSRNSSTHTLKQYANLIANQGLDGQAGVNERAAAAVGAHQSNHTSQEGSTKKVADQKKIFLFDQQKDEMQSPERNAERNKSPCFGSVKNSNPNMPISMAPQQLIMNTNNQRQLQDQTRSDSHNSLASLINNAASQQQQPPYPNRQPFQTGFATMMSGRSGHESSQDRPAGNGETGATAEIESNFGTLAQQQVVKHGMGTGYQTSTTHDQGSTNRRQIVADAASNRSGAQRAHRQGLGPASVVTHGSPVPQRSYQHTHRHSQDILPIRSVMNNEDSDLALLSSHKGDADHGSDRQISGHVDELVPEKVTSVVAFVKENSKIWE